MRTTLVLNDELYEAARRRAFEERLSIGAVISEWAAAGMQATRSATLKRPLGMFAGHVWVADDFDDTPAEWIESAETPLS